MRNYMLTIGWLYPQLMNTYGDRGNIMILQRRCEWRGIGVEIKNLDLGFKIDDLRVCDLLFMGGAQDRQQKIVSEDLFKKADVLTRMIKDGTPGLYICGAYQFLGKYYKEANGTIIKGLGILDLYTENPGTNKPRLIGNVIIEIQDLRFKMYEEKNHKSSIVNRKSSALVGFENHGGRTYLGKGLKPLGKVLHGFGNNGKDKTEGVMYKNSFGTYLHGPILPKNPNFADLLIKCALEKKYKKSIELSLLDDSLEYRAHQAVLKKQNYHAWRF
ncbi:MAG: hypothetical protein A3B53_02610 [Candidatus Levybacteria bacterium RIFCSPLOWO2_01_FULL_42_15]|nr:MAG: hypothetical protein A3B53_02610 [Candidatus Levybacteria bacterium RIFCSPLOWO2_01_FULL_42_15]